MAEMGRKVAADANAEVKGSRASAEAQASAAVERARLELQIGQMTSELAAAQAAAAADRDALERRLSDLDRQLRNARGATADTEGVVLQRTQVWRLPGLHAFRLHVRSSVPHQASAQAVVMGHLGKQFLPREVDANVSIILAFGRRSSGWRQR